MLRVRRGGDAGERCRCGQDGVAGVICRGRISPGGDQAAEGDRRRAASRRAQPIDRPVARNRRQPADDRTLLAVEQLGPVPQCQVGVLQDFLRQPPVAQPEQRDPEQALGVAVVQLAQRRFVALNQGGDQLLIGASAIGYAHQPPTGFGLESA